jgi:thioredoxin 2
MGFIRRLLGLETKPGEPESLRDELFEDTVKDPDMPVFIFFFNLWCSGCQVMHGLLNEVGPEYIGRARFYKMDATQSPRAVAALGLKGVPVLASFRPGEKAEWMGGLMNITELREWIDSLIDGTVSEPGEPVADGPVDVGYTEPQDDREQTL